MIPRNFRFLITNATGVSIPFSTTASFQIRGRPWKFATDGVLSYGTEQVLMDDSGSNLGTDPNTQWDIGVAQVNSANLYLGYLCKAVIDSTGVTSPNGNVDIWYEYSTEDTPVWPSAQTGFNPTQHSIWLRSIQLDTTDQQTAVNFELK